MKQIFYPVWQRFFIEFDEEKNIHQMSLELGVAYYYVFNTITYLKKRGLVNVTKSGRKNTLRLTVKGKKIRNALIAAYLMETGG